MYNPFKREKQQSLENQIIDNRYDIGKRLGEGAFGDVYSAKDISLDRKVAIKVLKANWLNQQNKKQTLAEKQKALANFITEAQITCKVQHANAVIVYDTGVYNQDLLYLVMEFINGKTLSDYFSEKKQQLKLAETYTIVKQICAALSQAHLMSIVHRDLKPDNIMLTISAQDEVQVKVLDFGIAKILQEGVEKDSDFCGTPKYASPEQCFGKEVDGRSDIYSLGIILYQLLSNNCHPFPNAIQPEQFFIQHLNNNSPRSLIQANSSNPISKEINRVVMRCLETQPELRYASVIELLSDLKKAFFGLSANSDAIDQQKPQISMDEMLEIYDDALAQFKQGNYAYSFEQMNSIIEKNILDPQLIHLAILSLARSGANTLAMDYWQQYATDLPKTEDNLALKARLLKDQYKQTQDQELGIQARDEYLEIAKIKTGYYPLINAATLSYWLGDQAQAHKLAKQVLELCETEPSDYWCLATKAEACLLLNQLDNVKEYLQRASELININHSDLSVTYQQLKLICQSGGIDQNILLAIKPPCIAHYTGHMVHGIGSSPGIDPNDEAYLRKEADTLIEQEKIAIAYGALASGADIIFAEALIARQAELHVVLPFSKEKFIEISVLPAGKQWQQRFENLLEHASSVRVLFDFASTDLELQFQLNTKRAIGLTLLHAGQLQTHAVQLAMFSGLDTGRKAGTAADIKLWKNLDYQSMVITTPTPRQAVSAAELPELIQLPQKQQYKTFVFAKIYQYSKITDPDFPQFMQACSARFKQHLLPYLDHQWAIEIWGDRILFTMDDELKTMELCLKLIDSLALETRKNQQAIGLQLFIHSGLVFQKADSLFGQERFYGENILKTGQIFLNLPVNSIYVSEEYAAQLILSAPKKYRYCYAGLQVLPENSGQFRLYSIEALPTDNGSDA